MVRFGCLVPVADVCGIEHFLRIQVAFHKLDKGWIVQGQQTLNRVFRRHWSGSTLRIREPPRQV